MKDTLQDILIYSLTWFQSDLLAETKQRDIAVDDYEEVIL